MSSFIDDNKALDKSPVPPVDSPKMDYDKYKGRKCKVRLLNVPWNKPEKNVSEETTSDVAFFSSRAEFMDWVEQQNPHVFYGDMSAYLKHTEVYSKGLGEAFGTLRVMLPYEVAIAYNYVIFEYPPLPVPSKEGTDSRTTFCFFINGYDQMAPNTTEYQIQLDPWQTFIYDISVSEMLLQEGHAVTNKVTPQQYLSCPIENHEWLGSGNDIELSRKLKMTKSQYKPFNTGKQYIVIAFSGDVLYGTWNTNATTDTEVDAVIGWSIGRTGFHHAGPKQGDHGHSATESDSSTVVNAPQFPTTPTLQFGNPTMLQYIAVNPEDMEQFINNMTVDQPLAAQCIEGFYQLPAYLCNVSAQHTLFGVPCWELNGTANATLGSWVLDWNDFQYTDAKNWTKAYTSPYATMTITDGQRSVDVELERIHHLAVELKACPFIPFLNIQAFVSGIDGDDASATYQFKYLNRDETVDWGNSRWQEFAFKFDVPVFSLYINPYYIAKAKYAAKIAAKRIALRIAEETARTEADIIWNDTCNAIDTQNQITIRDITTQHDITATNIATTKTNGDRTANTQYANAVAYDAMVAANKIASSNMNRTNNESIARQNKDNAVRLHNLQAYVDEHMRDLELELLDNEKAYNEALFDSMNFFRDDFAADEMGHISLGKACEMARDVGRGAVVAGAGGAANVAVPAGVAEAAALTTAYTLVAATYTACSIQVETDFVDNKKVHEYEKAERDYQALQTRLTDDRQADQDTKTDITNETLTQTNQASQDLFNKQLAAYNLQNATEIANANREQSTNDANAARTLAAQLANNALQYSNDNWANDANRDAQSADNWDTIEMMHDGNDNTIAANYYRARRQRLQGTVDLYTQLWEQYANRPTASNATSGNLLDAQTGYMGLGIQVNAMNRADEKRVAAKFRNKGYLYESYYEWDKWCGHTTSYTYWKAKDVQLHSSIVAESVKDAIRRLLRRGVRVWNDPNDIGIEGYHDNEPIY